MSDYLRIVLLCCGWLLPAAAEDKITIAVVYGEMETGRNHLSGVKHAVAHHPLGKRIELLAYPYHGDKGGFEVLEQLITRGIADRDTLPGSGGGKKNRKPDLILGPTDSGAFTELINRRAELEAHGIPVISSLVTAQVENRPEGWFFRTNVGITRRAQLMYDFLNKYWVRRIGVLYSDDEFGRGAEQAFRDELHPGQKNAYQAFPFEFITNSRFELKQVLSSKPEVLGIFGSREEIRAIYSSLKSINNSIMPYDPLLFTVIDARGLIRDIPEFYFVSLTEMNPSYQHGDKKIEFNGDVDALAFDTAWLALNELQAVDQSDIERQSPRGAFRQRFETLLDDGQTSFKPVTGMVFSSHENKAMPKLFRVHHQKAVKIDPGRSVGIINKIGMKVDLVWRGVGFFPLIVVVMFLAISYMLGFHEISARYPDLKGQIIRRYNFHLVVWINFLMVLFLYFILAEIGAIAYDSLLASLMIVFTAKAILHSTIFETPAGKAIGLSGYHDRLVSWLGERIMVTAYDSEKSNINVLAYHNTLQGMVQELKSLYRNARSSQQAREMISQLEKELDLEKDTLRKRKICARRLMRRLSWKKLQERNFAPRGISEKATDPERIIRAAVDYCLQSETRIKHLEELVHDKMLKVSLDADGKLKSDINQRFHHDIRNLSTEDRIHTYLGYLFLYFGFGDQQLIEYDFLENPEWIIGNCTLSCELSSKKWDNLQKQWRDDLKNHPFRKARKLQKRLRAASGFRNVLRTQFEFLAHSWILSRRRMVDLGLCYSNTELFSLSYRYCQTPCREVRCLETLGNMIVNYENRSRFADNPKYESVKRAFEELGGKKSTPDRETRRQAIKKGLTFLIFEHGYGSYPLLQRGLFPNADKLITECEARTADDKDYKRLVLHLFFAEMRDSEKETRRFYMHRFADGLPLIDKIKTGWKLKILSLGIQSDLSRLDRRKINLMIRFLLHKYDYQLFELSRLGLFSEDDSRLQDIETESFIRSQAREEKIAKARPIGNPAEAT